MTELRTFCDWDKIQAWLDEQMPRHEQKANHRVAARIFFLENQVVELRDLVIDLKKRIGRLEGSRTEEEEPRE